MSLSDDMSLTDMLAKDMSDYNQEDDMSNMSSLHDTILLGVLVTLAVVVVALILAVLLDTVLAMVKGRRERDKEGEEEEKEKEGGEEDTPATCAPPCSHWPSCVTPCNTTEFSLGNNYGDVMEKHHDLPTEAGLPGCHTRWK